MGRGAVSLQTSPEVVEHFLAPNNPGRECGRMLVGMFKMRAKKHLDFGSTGNVIVGTESGIQEKS